MYIPLTGKTYLHSINWSNIFTFH